MSDLLVAIVMVSQLIAGFTLGVFWCDLQDECDDRGDDA